MQRLFASPWTPEQYDASQAHRQIVPESVCPSCEQPSSLNRHGSYPRWVVSVVGKLLRLWIARFLCRLCRRTISYLPDSP
jgi:transposase-like protein